MEPENLLRLRFVGFCGVDESFNPPPNKEWPAYVEWGVLFRQEFQGKKMRFPSLAWIKDFCAREHGRNLAAHLCSYNLEQVIVQRDYAFVEFLVGLGFKRFQLNATAGNGVNMSLLRSMRASDLVDNLFALAQQFPNEEFIIQYNEETRPFWELVETSGLPQGLQNISLLFDASVGTGREITHFPRPNPVSNIPYGYAGGINPGNVERILRAIPRDGGAIWIDMESGIRKAENDSFSWEKCQQVIAAVERLRDACVLEF